MNEADTIANLQAAISYLADCQHKLETLIPDESERDRAFCDTLQRVKDEQTTIRNYLEDLPNLQRYRSLIAQIKELDPRLSDLSIPSYKVTSHFISLRPDESFRDFKRIVGRILLLGFKLKQVKEDADFGSVDYQFQVDLDTAGHSRGSLNLYVSPGESANCQVTEVETIETVKHKRIVCGGQAITAEDMA